MQEPNLIKVRSIYGKIKGYLEGLPDERTSSGPWIIPQIIGVKFNEAIDELGMVTKKDCSKLKIKVDRETLNIREVKPAIHAAVCKLEEEYNLGKNIFSPATIIYNKNENKTSIQITYTLQELIENADDESKNKLKQLYDELNTTNRNWSRIKPIIVWILNFSKELFIKVIPILLEKKL